MRQAGVGNIESYSDMLFKLRNKWRIEKQKSERQWMFYDSGAEWENVESYSDMLFKLRNKWRIEKQKSEKQWIFMIQAWVGKHWELFRYAIQIERQMANWEATIWKTMNVLLGRREWENIESYSDMLFKLRNKWRIEKQKSGKQWMFYGAGSSGKTLRAIQIWYSNWEAKIWKTMNVLWGRREWENIESYSDMWDLQPYVKKILDMVCTGNDLLRSIGHKINLQQIDQLHQRSTCGNSSSRTVGGLTNAAYSVAVDSDFMVGCSQCSSLTWTLLS